MKFYSFYQNNSGGRFTLDYDAGISQYVIIEAEDVEDACRRAEAIGIYFNGCIDGRDCECCGDRWYSPDESDRPALYDIPIEDYLESFIGDEPYCYVHFADGTRATYK